MMLRQFLCLSLALAAMMPRDVVVHSHADAVATSDFATGLNTTTVPETSIVTLPTSTVPSPTNEPEGNALIASLPQCPFSRWQGEPRYCYECRWCPFRDRSCCEIEDEVDALKAINVSGSDDWDCFITIAHFQQCGRCSPDAKSFVQQTDQEKMTLKYVWDPRNLSIRPCKQACKYIYKQCNRASLLDGTPIIPAEVTEGEFCAPYPEISTPDMPCYNSANSELHNKLLGAFLLVAVIFNMLHASLF